MDDQQYRRMTDLQKIAHAINRLADAMEAFRKPVTPVTIPSEKTVVFPLKELSNRARNALRNKPGFMKNETEPLTCNELYRYGCNRCLEIQGFGMGCAQEVAKVMGNCGFPNWLNT